MKKHYLIFLAIAFIASSLNSFGQITFSVSPGIHLNGAQFGYSINGKITPYIGIQYLKAGFNNSYSSTHYDYDVSAVRSYTDSEEIKASVFIPTLGLKYRIVEKEKLKAYLNLALTKPMVNAEFKFNGEVEEEVDEILKNISFFGAQLGFGSEYFVDENFSISGEFGLAYMKFKYSYTYDTDYWNPDLGVYVDTKAEEKIDANVLPTYSKISLNFYF